MMAKSYFWFVVALALACFVPGVAAQVSTSTAFAVAPGLLITNQHVVAGCTSVDVVAANGRRAGSIVDADPLIDLALLRVNDLKGTTARLRSPRNVRLGESVMVFGFPLAGSLSSSGNFTSGLVSALRGLKDAAGALQITAPVQPGSSGGPLMDASGLVIGVVQAKLDALRAAIATGDIPQNVNFAISLQVLAEFLAKNGVAFREDARSAPLDTARVAELAQSFTYRVECRGRSQQAAASPSIKQGRLPLCPGSYNAVTWTNCVGEWTSPNGDQKYVGEFRDSKYDGQGTLTLSNGIQYVGEWRKDKRNGQGVETSTNGQNYVGEWRNDSFHGQGTFTGIAGKYVGGWSDSKMHGKGTITHPNGQTYVGEFREDNYHGEGTYTWPDGQKYVGEYKDGKYSGLGTFTLSNGTKYVGEWRNAKRDGRGTLYNADGLIVQSGIWENNVFEPGR